MTHLPHYRISDIESAMDAVVNVCRGKRIPIAVTNGRAPHAADYHFPEFAVIGELKCMEHDTQNDGSVKQKVNAMYWRWVDEGKIHPPLYGVPIVIDTKALPTTCAYELLELLKRRLERLVDQAHKQIRASKEQLGLKDGKGLLLLANDGDWAFDTEVTAHLLARILKGRYRELSTVVFFTPNMRVGGTPAPQGAHVWANMVIPDRDGPRSGVPDELLKLLGESWFRHLGTLTGQPVTTFHHKGAGPEVVEQLRFIRDQSGTGG